MIISVNPATRVLPVAQVRKAEDDSARQWAVPDSTPSPFVNNANAEVTAQGLPGPESVLRRTVSSEKHM